MRSKNICLIILIALSIWHVSSKPIYDHKKSYVTQLTSLNFKDQVEKIRQNTNYVSIVHYYKFAGNCFVYVDGASQGLVKEIDTWVNQFNGVFRIGAVDCDDFPKVCADQGVKVFPTVKIYPPVPIPATDLTVNVY